MRNKGMSILPKWEFVACDEQASERLAAELAIAPIVARLLCQRGPICSLDQGRYRLTQS